MNHADDRLVGPGVILGVAEALVQDLHDVLQLVAESGVRDVDQGMRTLADGLAPQLGRAVLGYDDVGVVLVGAHGGTRSQPRHYLRDGVVLGGGAQADEPLPVLGEPCAAGEIRLPARGGVVLARDLLRSALPQEIHLYRCVDGDDVVYLREQARVVRFVHGPHAYSPCSCRH